MARFLAGALVCFLLMTGAFLIWQGRAARGPALPSAPAQAAAFSAFGSDQPLSAPEASPQSREQRRFSRADKNKDGKIEAEEYLAGRRRYFDKLDVNHDGRLTFEEYAAKGITKFQTADQGHKGWLNPGRIRDHRCAAIATQELQLWAVGTPSGADCQRRQRPAVIIATRRRPCPE